MCSIDIDNGNLLERPIGGPGHLFPWETGLPQPARRRIMHMRTCGIGGFVSACQEMEQSLKIASVFGGGLVTHCT